MSFQPFLNQLIADAQHNYLLPNALTLAALGTTDSQIRKCRAKLEQGKHFLYAVGDDRLRRLYYTYQGLLELSILLGTERAKSFREALLAVASGTANVHRPAGHIVPPVRHSEPENNIQPLPSPLSHPQQLPHGLPPEVFSELVALKRDEIELRRSEQETERLHILQTAYQQQQPAPLTRQGKSEPPLLVVENNFNNGWRFMDDPLAATLILMSFIFLGALLIASIGVVAGGSVQRETQINVR